MVSNETKGVPGDESVLVQRLKQGREDAFRELFDEFQQQVYKVAFGITMDSEESLDIVQDVFLKVHRNIHKFKGQSKLSTWIHRITVNACLNWKRKLKRRFKNYHYSIDDEDLNYLETINGDTTVETLYQNKELQMILQKSIKKLPEDARVVFILKEIEGLAYDEIAEVLGISKGTVSSRLYHARRKLKNLLNALI